MNQQPVSLMGFYGRVFEGPSRKRQRQQDDIATTPCQEMIFNTNTNFTPMSYPSFLAMVIQLGKKQVILQLWFAKSIMRYPVPFRVSQVYKILKLPCEVTR